MDYSQFGNNSDPQAVMSALLPFLIFTFILSVFMIIAQWKIYSKAGKPGWAAIIPIYNTIVLLEITGRPVWWIILLLIPVVNIIFAIIVLHDLSLSFGKGAGFTIGMLVLPFIFFPILGFGSARYQGPGGRGPHDMGGSASADEEEEGGFRENLAGA